MQDEKPSWTFLTNHAHVLLCIADDPDIRGSDIATKVGITLRSAQSIVRDLVEGGYVTSVRVGRRNHYEVHTALPFRHPIERGHQIAELLRLVEAAPESGPSAKMRNKLP